MNYLVIVGNCHCTSAHVAAHVSAHYGGSAHHSTTHMMCQSMFREVWSMLKPSPIKPYSPHNLSTCSTHIVIVHQPTSISPYTRPAPPAHALHTSSDCSSSWQTSLALHTSHTALYKQSTTKPLMSCTTIERLTTSVVAHHETVSTHHGPPMP